MGDGDGSQAILEVCTVPFGQQTCLPPPEDPVRLTAHISHTPALIGSSDTAFPCCSDTGPGWMSGRPFQTAL